MNPTTLHQDVIAIKDLVESINGKVDKLSIAVDGIDDANPGLVRKTDKLQLQMKFAIWLVSFLLTTIAGAWCQSLMSRPAQAQKLDTQMIIQSDEHLPSHMP